MKNQEDTTKTLEIQTTTTSTTVIKETDPNPSPEHMSRDSLLSEVENLQTGRSCFWTDESREIWLKRLEARAIELNTVELLAKLQKLRETKT